ncbi:MAG: EAL domain-containing protein [Nocardioidaceae bacterium]
MLDGVQRARRFEALVHADSDFIAFAALDGAVELVNEAGQALVGIDPGTDVTTLRIEDFLTPEGRATYADVEGPALAGAGHWSGVSSLRDWRDDSAIPTAVTTFQVLAEGTGQPIAIATIRRDLRAEQAAEASWEDARGVLVDAGRRKRSLLLHMSDLLLVVDESGRLEYASPSAGRILGYAEGSYAGRQVLDLVHPEDRGRAEEALVRIAAHPEEKLVVGLRLRSSDGSFRSYEGLANNLVDDPSVRGVLLSVRDVTRRLKVEEATLAQSRVLELIAGEAPVATVLEALALAVEQQLDDTLCTVLLVEESQAGPVFRHGASPSMPAGYAAAMEERLVTSQSPCGMAVRTGRPVLVEDVMADERFATVRRLARDCDVRACWSFPVLSPTSGALLGSFALYRRGPGLPDEPTTAVVARASRLVAITVDRHVLLRRLAYQALHDDLTGLSSRPALLTRLDEELSGPDHALAGLGIVFLDLDRLKIVNDSLGHEVGDELLVRIARRLPDVVPADSLVARFGGDEFVILVHGLTDHHHATLVAERLLAAVAEPVTLAGRTITPSASAGVVIARPGQRAADMLRDADTAMYRAKRRGGSRCAVFTDDMRRRAFDRLDLEGQIRHGLAHQEFRVFYQPVVDLHASGALVGFEALVRWQHPDRGLLAPASFIDLAEETGLIVELGDWVLRTVAATVATWSVEVPGVLGRVAVNLATRQLDAAGLMPTVRAAIEQMAPWILGLELTESTLMEDTSAGRVILDELVGLGVALSIDDFGTGFSSLSYLTRLPVKTLKIDQSFVRDLDTPASVAVVETVLTLARSLDMLVIAEGVETEEQRATLTAMGCRFAQGYLFARPMPEADALELLRSTAAGVA